MNTINEHSEARIFLQQESQAILKRPRDWENDPEEMERVKKIHKFCSEKLIHYPSLTENNSTLSQLQLFESTISHLIQSDEDRLFQEIIKRPFLTVTLLESSKSDKRVPYTLNTAQFANESKFFKKYLLNTFENKELNFQFTFEEFAYVEGHLIFSSKPPLEWAKRVLMCADYLEIPRLCKVCIQILIDHSKTLDEKKIEDTLQLIELLNETEMLPHFPELKKGYENEFSRHVNYWLCLADDPVIFKDKELKIKEALKTAVGLTLNKIKNNLTFYSLIGMPIRFLSLESCNQLSEEVLKVISQMPGLEELEFSDCPFITNANLKLLSEAAQLKKLGLKKSNRKMSDFENLPPTIQELHIEGYDNITNASFTAIHKLEQLHTLYIKDCRSIDDNALQMLPKNLVNLSIVGCPRITQNLCGGLFELKKLQYLKLEMLAMNELNVSIVPEFSFTELEIVNCPITNTALEKIAKLKNLKKLILKNYVAINHPVTMLDPITDATFKKLEEINPQLDWEWNN